MTQLTKREEKALRYLGLAMRERHLSPTHRELCEYMGYRSTNAVSELINSLEAKQMIKRSLLMSRAIVLTESGWEYVGIPKGACPFCFGKEKHA